MQTVLQNNKSSLFALSATHKRIVLYFILVAALLFRLYHIDQPYTDLAGWRQSSTAMMADNFYHRNPNILYPEISWNGPGESYNGREFQTITYLSNLLYRLLGQHDWVGRMVAVLFGVWGVFALYQLVRRIWGEKRALASAAILALLPGAIYFDRSFLPDPAMVSLITTSLWMLIAYLQTDRKRYLILTMIAACLGFLTKITGMLVLLPMLYAILAILNNRKMLTIPAILKIVVPGLAAIAVVASYYLWARHLSLHYPPYHFAGTDNWLWDEGLKVWLQQAYFFDSFQYIARNWLWGWPFIALFITGIVVSVLYKNDNKQNSRVNKTTHHAPNFFHFWLLACVVFYAMGAKELIGNFWNFHIWSPVVAAFSGSALVFVWNMFRKKNVLAFVTAIFIFACIAISNRYVLANTFTDTYYKSDYQMGLRLRELRQPDDLVIVLAREPGSPIAIYYSNGRGWPFPPAGKEVWGELPPTSAACITMLEELHKKGADWFGIYRAHYDTIKTTYPQFAHHLTSRYILRAEAPDYVIFQLQPK